MSDDLNGTSRRRMLRGGVALLAAGIAAGTATAQEKLAKDVVQYQQTPKDGAKCDDCANWVAPNGCKIVDGTINANGWCVAFAPKG